EGYALDRSRRSVENLMDLTPNQITVIDGEAERTFDVDDVPAGTLVRVRPGERVALDGNIVAGNSSLDEAPITGESMPRDRSAGEEVFAGSLNGQGGLTVKSTSSAENSTLARIAQLVDEAQGSQAPSERFVDRFARIYTPIVFLSALLVAAVPIALGASADTWIYRSLALLIVACPCSLVISIPVSVVSAIGGAARRGVLIKGGQALEDLARVRTVALDKTGTLTLGQPRLVEVIPMGDRDRFDEAETLRLVASLELQSEHPLAGALTAAARERNLTLVEPGAFEALPGRGAIGRIEGHQLWAGGPRLAEEKLGQIPPEVLTLEQRGYTVIVLGDDEGPLGAFGLADTVRPEAADALDSLRNRGLGRQVMLTGDNGRVAASVAQGLGIAEWQAGLLPEDKLREVRELELEAGGVMMVGDGINDAPSLAAARVGVAMGAAGSDAAIAASDVALLSDDLGRLPEAARQSQRALSVMRQNVIISLVVKGVFVVLAPFGLVTLVMAVAADVGMSLLVTLNGLRLLGRPERKRR
ncbi:MAG: cation-translocating P-type ATPase, partial [Solirubrobacterales bacterium]